MNSAAECTASISRARRTVEAALEHWNAADLSRCAETVELLASAARDLESCQPRMLRSTAAVLEIQSDLHHLTRLVDAAAAFSRSIAPMGANEANAGLGHIVAEA